MQTEENVITPGAAIQQELDARGWNQADLAQILGVHQSVVSALITGKRPISLGIARDLSAAFGTDMEYWMKLETDFRLVSAGPADESIGRRARIFEAAPVKDMVKRRWIQETADIELLEKQILGFYNATSLDDIAGLAHAARKSTSYSDTKPPERAWMQRVKRLGHLVSANQYCESNHAQAINQLRQLLAHAENARHIPKLLAEAGIRLVIVEPLPRTRIDGVCVWLDKFSPVIGLSLRMDRIDSLWFTLFHEMWHVKNLDGLATPAIVDSDLSGETSIASNEKPESERRADEFAGISLIAREELENFIARVGPLFSKMKIEGFAARLGIHPAIVVGQLQHRREIPWSQNREFLVKVREIVTQSALTDGWGHMLPAVS